MATPSLVASSQTLRRVCRSLGLGGGYLSTEQEAAGGPDHGVGRAINYEETSGSPISKQTVALCTAALPPSHPRGKPIKYLEWFL